MEPRGREKKNVRGVEMIARPGLICKTVALVLLFWGGLGPGVSAAVPAGPGGTPRLAFEGRYVAYSADLGVIFVQGSVRCAIDGIGTAAGPGGPQSLDLTAERLVIDLDRWRLLAWGGVRLGAPQSVVAVDQLALDLRRGTGWTWTYGRRLQLRAIEGWTVAEGQPDRAAPLLVERVDYGDLADSFLLVTAARGRVEVEGEIELWQARVRVDGADLFALAHMRFRSSEGVPLSGVALEAFRLSSAAGLTMTGAYGFRPPALDGAGRVRLTYEEYGFLDPPPEVDRRFGLGTEWSLGTSGGDRLRLLGEVFDDDTYRLSLRLDRRWEGEAPGSLGVEAGRRRLLAVEEGLYLLAEHQQVILGSGLTSTSLRAASTAEVEWRSRWTVPLGRRVRLGLSAEGRQRPSSRTYPREVRNSRVRVSWDVFLGGLTVTPSLRYDRDAPLGRDRREAALELRYRRTSSRTGALLRVDSTSAYHTEALSGGAGRRRVVRSDVAVALRSPPLRLAGPWLLRAGVSGQVYWREGPGKLAAYRNEVEVRRRLGGGEGGGFLGARWTIEAQRSLDGIAGALRLRQGVRLSAGFGRSGEDRPAGRAFRNWVTVDLDGRDGAPVRAECLLQWPLGRGWTLSIEGGYQFQYASWATTRLFLSRDVRRAELRWSYYPVTEELIFEVVPKLFWKR